MAHEDELEKKDSEIAKLRAQLERYLAIGSEGQHHSSEGRLSATSQLGLSKRTRVPVRKGKAPPIDSYTGESSDVLWEDWLPTFEIAANWNEWTEDEKVIQLAGHLQKKALQEWNLLDQEDRSNYSRACQLMQAKMDPDNKAIAAQDFRHTVQEENELVIDFIRCLERTFRRTYGGDILSNETKDALLYEQLQEGLSYNLMKSPAVSGAKGYQELCQAAKSDERRQQGLSRRQMYQRDDPKGNSNQKKSVIGAQPVVIKQQARLQSTPEMGVSSMRCYNCSQVGHVAKYCPEKKAARVMAPGDSEDAASHTPCDPWIRTVATVTKQHSLEVSQRQGPVYKVDVEIEGLKTRALLDHGAQVSLIRKQMLPQIQEDRGWTKEQCHSRNLVLDQQPVGAEGNSLGAVGVVQLQVKVENMGVHRQVPFYVLDSSKPIWNG